MFLSKAVFRTAVLVIFCVAPSTTSSSSSSCPLACLCERGPHINCSSLGLREVPLQIPETVASLNLSNNALRTLPPLWPGRGIVGGLRYLWLDHNKMETFSLCTRRNRIRLKTLAAESCESWAPGLEQLSAVRNRMHQVPRGLRGSANLRILQLSHNKISTLDLLDFQGCRQLKELHLQGNLISTINPLAFKDMQELQVLDLRFNLLTTIPSPVYLSLLNLRTQVDLSNNRWTCDCNLRGIRNRLMQMDLDQISQSWRMICSSPLRHAGQQLMQLQDQDLMCPLLGHGHVEHFDEVAEEGSQILLPCGSKNQDCSQALWWTPQGQVTGTQHGLLLTNIIDRDAGLYVCVSGKQQEQVSVFDLHVDLHEATGTRLKRAVDHADSRTVEVNSQRNQVRALKTQSEFDLAVGLSVFFTFIIAFIIGVLVRPCLDTLWTKLRAKRSSSDPPSPEVVVTTQSPAVYDNEGFAMSEEPGQVHVGHRVTFAEVTQPTYDRPVDENDDTSSESSVENEPLYENTAQNFVEVENLETQQQSSRNAERQGSEASGKNPVMEYEPIPDPEFKKDTSSISSASSISDQEQEPLDDTYESMPTTVQKTNRGEPEVDWATKQMEQSKDQTSPLDPELWNDSGESFSFTDGSERSSTRDKSHSQASTQPAAETGVLQPEDSDDDVALPEPKPLERQADEDEVPDQPIYEEISRSSSSADSVDSGDEPTEYTVNPDEDDDEEEKTLDPTFTEKVIPLQSHTRVDSTGQDKFFGERPRVDTILLEPEDIKLTIIHDSSDPGALDEDPFFSEEEPSHRIRPVLPQWQNYTAQRDKFSSSEGEEEPKKYNVHPVYRKRPIVHSTSDSYSERASLSSEDEEASPRYRPQTSIKNGADMESRPITINTSSLSVTTDLPIKRPDKFLNIDFDNSATNTDEFETGNSSGPLSPFQIEATIRGVSLDQVILPKRALIFVVKNTENQEQVPLRDQRQISLSSSGAVMRPGLGSQLSTHSRSSVSSQSSVSSDENDFSATNTDYLNITDRNSSLSEARRRAPSPPPFRMEGTMERISLEQIPFPKRALVFGIKNTEKDKGMPVINQRQPVLSSLSGAGLTGSQMSNQSRPRLSSQSSVSSDENDNTPTITEITGKNSSVSGPPKHPSPPPPFRTEGTVRGAYKDQRQTSEFRPRVSSLSSVSSNENDFSVTNTDISYKTNSISGSYRRAPSPPPFRMEGTMERISLDKIPYPKRALTFGVWNSLDHMQVPMTSQRQPSLSLSGSVVRPSLTGSHVSSHSRQSVSSLSSVTSDENDVFATIKDITYKASSLPGSHRRAPSPPPFRMEGTMERISLDNIPFPKRHLVFGIENSEDHKRVPMINQKPPSLSPISGSTVRPGLTSYQVSSQSRPRLSSQSSVSSDEDDNSPTITEITGKTSSVSRPPKYVAPPPPIKIEGTMGGVSFDEIPLPKRRLAFGIKNSEDHMDVPVSSTPVRVVRPGLTGQYRPTLSSQSSVSSDESDHSASITEITGKYKSGSRSPKHPAPPPPVEKERTMGGVSLDQIQLPKRRLAFGIKNTEDHKEVPLTDQRQPGLSSLSGVVVSPGLTGQSRPRLSSQSSVSSDDNDNSATITEITDKSKSVSRSPKYAAPPPPVKTGGTMSGVSLDQIQLPKRRLAFGIKNTEDHKEVPLTDQRQPGVSSLSGVTSRPGLTGQSRQRLSSQSSVSSDDNDNSATITEITVKSKSVSRSPKYAAPPPPVKTGGTMSGVSLDQIQLPKRRLAFGIKNTEDHKEVPLTDQRQPGLSSLSGVVVSPGLTGQSRPRLSSQSSVSSDDNDNSATITEITVKSKSVSRSPKYAAPPPPVKTDGTMSGVSLDQIQLPKRRLAFGIKNSEDHMDVPVSSTPVSVVRPGLTGQSRPTLSSQSSVSSDENDNSATITEIIGKNKSVSRPPKYAAPPPLVKTGGTMSGVSLDQIQLPKRRLAFGIKNTEDHKEVPLTDQRQPGLSSLSGVVVSPGLTGQSRPRLSSQSSVSSDENYNTATITEITDKNISVSSPPKYAPPTPPVKLVGTISLDKLTLPKRRLAFGIKNTQDYEQVPLIDQRQSSWSSITGNAVRSGLTGQSRPRLSSESSVSSDENDKSSNIKDRSNEKNTLLGHSPSTPQSQRETMIMGDQIPLPKRRLAFGIKNSEDHKAVPEGSISGRVVRPGLTASQVSSHSRPRLSSQSSVSSDENDNTATITEIRGKNTSVSSPPKYAPLVPPVKTEERMGGVILDEIPLPKRRLAFGIKNSEDHKDIPKGSISGSVVRPGLTASQVTSQSRPRLSSQSSVSSDDDDNTGTITEITGKNSNVSSPPKYAPPASQVKLEARMSEGSLDKMPLPKRRLAFGIKNSEDNEYVSVSSSSGSIRPGLTGRHTISLSSESSGSSDENDNTATITEIRSKNTSVSSPPKYAPLVPPVKTEERMGGVILDEIPLPKRRFTFGIKNSEDHKDVPEGSISGSVVRPGLTASQVSSHSRPRLSSQSSVSSDENDNTATITEITGKNSNVSSPPKYAPPASQVKLEARMSEGSLDKMPLPKRRLAFGIKNSEDNEYVSVSSSSGSIRPGLTGRHTISLSSESSGSSDENDNTATITEIRSKNTSVSSPPKYAPLVPPVKTEERMGGVILDKLPLPKRRLAFGIKNSEDHKDVPERSISGSVVRPGLTASQVSSHSRPRLSSQSSVSSDENDNTGTIIEIRGKNTSVSSTPKYTPPAPPVKTEGRMGGVILDEIPLPKRHLAFGIKNTEDHKDAPVGSISGSVVRPGLTASQVSSHSRPRFSSQSSVSSDENDNTATITEITGKNSNVSNLSSSSRLVVASDVTSDSQQSLNAWPVKKRPLLVIRSEDTRVVRTDNALNQTSVSRLSVSSQSSESSDENDTEKLMTIPMDRLPQYKRRSLLSSPVDDSLTQKQITTTIQREIHVPNFNSSYKVSVRTDSISDATIMKREQPLKQGLNHRESVSSVSSHDSASPGGDGYKSQNSFAFDHLPKPLKSTRVTSSSFSETANNISPTLGLNQELNQNQHWKTGVPRGSTMGRLSVSSQGSTTSSTGLGGAIPYHSDHTYRSVSTRSAVVTSTTSMSSNVSNVPRGGLQFGRTDEDEVMF